MLYQVAITLLAFVTASGLALWRGNVPIVSYHIIFAVGVVPLILGAMIYFVPVLTRSKVPSQSIRLLPYIALLGGLLVTAYFTFPQAVPAGHYLGSIIIIMTILRIGAWAYYLRIKTIGTPHPCLDWYLAAIFCLFLALCAILAGYFMPSQRAALRLLHLHLNTLGFIGITALATLQVLLPTITQQADANIASRMHQHFKWLVLGTVIIACGAAWHHNLAWIGMALLAIPIIGIIQSWLPSNSKEIVRLHGAATSLAVALCGYIMALVLGTIHAYYLPGINPIVAYIIAFLMPLVIGAVSYLLPIWLHPGQQTPWHQAARRHLGFLGGLRALILFTGGLMASLGYVAGWYLAILAVSAFLAQTLLLFIMVRG